MGQRRDIVCHGGAHCHRGGPAQNLFHLNGGADEISYYALAISSSWTFGYALMRKAHIRIDVLYTRMSSNARIALDLLSLTLFGACASIATYFAFFVLQTSIRRGSVANTPLGTPLWIPQSLWFAGLVFLCLVILVLLAGTIYRTMCTKMQRARMNSPAPPACWKRSRKRPANRFGC
jgi:TRAP-type mannitol/chloroaromatic compound transport system permease small subunit